MKILIEIRTDLFQAACFHVIEIQVFNLTEFQIQFRNTHKIHPVDCKAKLISFCCGADNSFLTCFPVHPHKVPFPGFILKNLIAVLPGQINIFPVFSILCPGRDLFLHLQAFCVEIIDVPLILFQVVIVNFSIPDLIPAEPELLK